MKTRTKRKAAATPPDTEPDEILCRPDRGIFVALGISFALVVTLGAIAIASETRWERPQAKTLAVISLLLFTILVIAALAFVASRTWRRELRADADGLHEQDRHGNIRFLAWADIQDYYSLQPSALPGSHPVISGIIFGNNGERFAFRGDWLHHAPLAKRIKDRATRAQVHDWVGLGARACDDWPRTFHYQTVENDVLPWIIAPLAISGATAATVALARANFPYLALMGWGYYLTFTLLPSGVATLFAYLFCLVFIPDRMTRTRRSQRITLTPAAIHFEDGSRVGIIEWETITEARLVKRGAAVSRFLVHAANETFDFTTRIKDAALLQQAILYNAPRVREWRLPEDDSVLPTRHVTGSSGFVHHYRTRNNRALLWFPIALCAIVPLVFVMEWAAGVSVSRVDWLLRFIASFLLPLLWFWWRYTAAHVERDSDGMTFHTAGRVRHVLWSRITDFRMKNLIGKPMDKTVGGLGIGIIDSRVGRFVFFTNISERDRLIRAIETHLPGTSVTAEQHQATQ